MLGLIEDLWDKFHEELEPIATNLGIGHDTPNDRLTLLFVASKCGVIELDGDNVKYVDDMMQKTIATGHIEGSVHTVFEDPDFKALF